MARITGKVYEKCGACGKKGVSYQHGGLFSQRPDSTVRVECRYCGVSKVYDVSQHRLGLAEMAQGIHTDLLRYVRPQSAPRPLSVEDVSREANHALGGLAEVQRRMTPETYKEYGDYVTEAQQCLRTIQRYCEQEKEKEITNE